MALSYKTADGLLSVTKLEHLVFIAEKSTQNGMTEFDSFVCLEENLGSESNKQKKNQKKKLFLKIKIMQHHTYHFSRRGSQCN